MSEKYAVVYEETEYHSDDGYGSSYTSRHKVFKDFENFAEFEAWVIRNASSSAAKVFQAYKVQPLYVKTSIQVNVKVNG